jgi:hypothetical protein
VTPCKVALSLAALVAFGAAVAAASGCAGDTGSQRFDFEARAGGKGAATTDGHTFTNEKGWVISLTRANVTLGPVYLNVIPPLTDSSASLWSVFVRPVWAQAGGSHLDTGRMVGEVLSQITFDALSAELVPFPSRGTMAQEAVRTAEIWFYPAPGVSADATKIDTVALDVGGVATRESEKVRFRGQLILNDDWISEQTTGERGNQSITGIRKVRGVPATFFPTAGGQLELRFDVSRLFRGADFSSLEPNRTDQDGTKVLQQKQSASANRDQVTTNLYQGLRETSGTYSVHWAEP